MNFLVKVSYSKRIEIAVGTQIEIHGRFNKPDHLIASSIIDSVRGIVFSSHYSGPLCQDNEQSIFKV